MKMLECKVDLSLGYHPQTDGQSERFLRSIEQIVRYQIAPKQSNWASILQQSAFALNSTVHAAHYQSPFRLIYGFEPILPLNLAMQKLSSTNVQAVIDFVSQRLFCFDAVKLALAKSNEQMAIQANKHHYDVQINVGDLVYVSTEKFLLARQLSCKFAPRWVGQFPNGAIINSIAFCAELPAEYGRVHPVFNVSYIRPHVGPTPPSPTYCFTFR